MPQTTFRALLGFATLSTTAAGIAAAASPPPLIPSSPSAQIRVTIDAIDGFSGRLLCLTPSEHGAALVPAAIVPRRTCLSGRDWAARHVILADE